MITRSQSKLAAATADAPSEQPFRFLDLPKELRLMVFEELLDNPKSAVKFTAPRNLDVEEVHLDGMYYPSLLGVSKSIHNDYWSLCLRQSTLWVVYTCADSAQPDEEDSEEEKPTMPPLTDWVTLPTRILERVPEVIFKFEPNWMLPEISKMKSNRMSGLLTDSC